MKGHSRIQTKTRSCVNQAGVSTTSGRMPFFRRNKNMLLYDVDYEKYIFTYADLTCVSGTVCIILACRRNILGLNIFETLASVPVIFAVDTGKYKVKVTPSAGGMDIYRARRSRDSMVRALT